MENKSEDEVRKRWEQEAREKKELEDSTAQRSRKRPREIGYNGGTSKTSNVRLIEEGMLTPDESDELQLRGAFTISEAGSSRGRAKGKAGNSRAAGERAAAAKAKSRVTEILDDDD